MTTISERASGGVTFAMRLKTILISSHAFGSLSKLYFVAEKP